MNQNPNNLNQNDPDIQGSKGISNNQNLDNNYMEPQQENLNYQQTPSNLNSFDNNVEPSSTFNMDRKPKKFKLSLVIGIVAVVIVIGIIGLSIMLNNNKSTDNPQNNEQTTAESSNIPTEINKYWNINTKEFNASLFDGKFSIGGDVIQAKLTGKTLNENGYVLRIGSGLFEELIWDSDNNVYSDKSNGAYILKNNEELVEGIHLENYNKEKSLYSDNTEISFSWNDTMSKYNDIIIPTILIDKLDESVYDTLTVENIVDKLGAPTYVQGRLTKSIENGQFFKYVYVYNDYTLWFEMAYYDTLGITVTGFRYEGNQSFNQPCKYYDSDSDEFRQYDKSLDYLNEEQDKYEKSK